jgi:hypothetical protein
MAGRNATFSRKNGKPLRAFRHGQIFIGVCGPVGLNAHTDKFPIGPCRCSTSATLAATEKFCARSRSLSVLSHGGARAYNRPAANEQTHWAESLCVTQREQGQASSTYQTLYPGTRRPGRARFSWNNRPEKLSLPGWLETGRSQPAGHVHLRRLFQLKS